MPAPWIPLLLLAAAPAVDLSPYFAEAWSARPEVERARADVETARSARAAAGVWLENPQVQVGLASDAPFHNEGELDLDVQLSQELRWPGARLSLQRAGDASIEQARARLASARLGVAAEVEEAYAGVVAARITRAAWEEIAGIARTLDDVAQRKAAAGSIGSLEAALASADAASAEAQALSAQAAVVDAEVRLCAALGRSTCEPTADAGGAAWPLLVSLDAARAQPPEAQRAARLDAQAALNEKRAAEERTSAAALAWLPTAKLALGYSNERGVLRIPGITERIADDAQLLSAQLTVSLPAWDLKRDDVHAARAATHAAEASSRASSIASAGAVKSASAAYDAADGSARRLEEVQPRVDAALQDLARAVSAGAIALDDALTTRDRLLQARLGAVEAQRRRVIAHASLLRALAQPLVPGVQDQEGSEP